MARNKTFAAVLLITIFASPIVCTRPLRSDGSSSPSIANDRIHSRGLRLFGGVLLEGLANALQRPAQGEFLRALARVVAGRAGRGASVTVQDGFLSISGVEGSKGFNVEIQTDPITGRPFTIDPTTGGQIFVDPVTGLPVTDSGEQIQFQNSGFLATGPGDRFDQFGQAFTNGAQVSINPSTGLPLNPLGANSVGRFGSVQTNRLSQLPNTGFNPDTGLPSPQVGLQG